MTHSVVYALTMDGAIQSIKLISNNISYGPEPKKTDEVEQHLTISSSGNIWFSAKNYGQHTEGKGISRSSRLNIGKWKAEHLISLLNQLPEDDYFVTDCGSFELHFRYDNGHIRRLYGSLIGEVTVFEHGQPVDLTRLIRRYIPVHCLWVFDSEMSPDYEGKKAIHLFAKKWLKELSGNPQIDNAFEDAFGNECAGLGFQMDSGEEFTRQYPECGPAHNNVTEQTVENITDIDLLGSAVYSFWRFKTHWDYSYHLSPDDCSWIKLILEQMMTLTTKKK